MPAPPNQSAKDDLKVEIWSDKNSYLVGEKMKFHVRVNRDCYLTLLDLGTSGNVTVLFPNYYTKSNAVKADAEYIIPDPSAGFEFDVTGPKGIDLIRAIASKEPSVDLKDVMATFNADARSQA